MKYSFSLILALFALPLIAQFPTNSLEAYYSFDDCDKIDTSSIITADMGNINVNKVGDVFCDPTGCSVSGDGSLLFNDAPNTNLDGQLIFINSLANIFSTADFSLSFYIKPEYSPGIVNLFSKREDCTDFHAFSITYNPASNVINCTLSEDTGLNGNVKGTLDFNRCWQHVVLVRQGVNTLLYINGVLKDQKQAPSRIVLTNTIGLVAASGICEDRYVGNLDELLIYRRALSQREVDQLFLNPDQITNSDTTIFLGGEVEVELTRTCANSFLWTPATGVSDPTIGEPVLSPSQTTTYFIDMAGDNCQSKDSVTITVLDPDQLDCSIVYFPKAFTPNNDGLNDNFGISNPNAIDDLISFEIFDRWGSRVFSTDDPFEAWDGNFKGEVINPGVLLYRVRHLCEGEELVAVGSLSIIR